MKQFRKIAAYTLGIFILLFTSISYGASNQVRTNLGGTYDWAYAAVAQWDGKVLAAGVSNSQGTYDFALVRYNPDSSLDKSFGNKGIVFTDFNNSKDWAYAIALQSNGKIVVAGVSGRNFALVRYDTNGNLDNTFGDDGRLIDYRRPLTTNIIHGMAIQPDGKIVVAGVSFEDTATLSPNADFTLTRYLSDGRPDVSFGVGGIVTTDFSGGSYDEAYTLLLETNGNIVLGGYTNLRTKGSLYGADQLALAGYTTNGSLDPKFGKEGKVIIDGGSLQESILSLSITPESDIIAGGYVNGEEGGDLFLGQFDSSGVLKKETINDLGTHSERISSIVVKNDGKIFAGGQTATGNNADFSLFQYNDILELESITTTDFDGREDRIHALVVGPDGSIVVVGQSETDFAIVW